MRYIGAVLIGIGLVLLGIDLFGSFSSGDGIQLRSLGAWWAAIDRESLLLLQPAIERHISPVLWDPGIQTLLEWPAAVEFLLLGAALMLVFRRRRPRRTADRLRFRKR